LRILAGTRYKVVGTRRKWSDFAEPGKPIPIVVIVVSSHDIADDGSLITEIRAIAKCTPRVVVLADSCDANVCKAVLSAGAVAYLPRSISADTFLKSLDLVLAGEVVVPAPIMLQVLAGPQGGVETDCGKSLPQLQLTVEEVGRLSTREVDILKCIIQGDSNKHISRHFAIAETTVKVHVKSILRKINARNRTQAAIWGISHFPEWPARTAELHQPQSLVYPRP
jgi:two-component system nitrate/nitrite response regulator NarL